VAFGNSDFFLNDNSDFWLVATLSKPKSSYRFPSFFPGCIA
jgi:hypothetical protein